MSDNLLCNMASHKAMTRLLFADFAASSDLSTTFPFFIRKLRGSFTIRSSGRGLVFLVRCNLGGVVNDVSDVVVVVIVPVAVGVV